MRATRQPDLHELLLIASAGGGSVLPHFVNTNTVRTFKTRSSIAHMRLDMRPDQSGLLCRRGSSCAFFFTPVLYGFTAIINSSCKPGRNTPNGHQHGLYQKANCGCVAEVSLYFLYICKLYRCIVSQKGIHGLY